MYARAAYREDRRDVLVAAMRDIQFAALIAGDGARIEAVHLPVIVREAEDGLVLEAHVAAANPFWRIAAKAPGALAIFEGPHAYVSPTWLESREAGKAVPTWSYVAVHARGTLTIVEDRDWLLAHVTALTEQNEAGREAPWSVADASADHVERLLSGIVGLRLSVDELEGVWKMMQTQSEVSRAAVIGGLGSSARFGDREMAALMQAQEAERSDGRLPAGGQNSAAS